MTGGAGAAANAVPIRTVSLGTTGLQVAAQGLGCLPLGGAYGAVDEAEAVATVRRALDLGVTLLDMADVYGPYVVEEIVGRAIAGRRDEVVVATKFGSECEPDGTWIRWNGRPDYVRRALRASLRRLGVDHIDLYYLHRVDPAVPVAETWGAMAELVGEGTVRHLGLCEVGPATLRRVHALHPVTALQSEYSLFSRQPEGAVLDTLRELGIGLVAYCPLGRGLLTGELGPSAAFPPGDNRRGSPRFEAGNLARNLALAGRVAALAEAKGVTPAQLALAWLAAQGDDVVAIPGADRPRYVEENVAALDLVLDAADVAALDAAVPPGAVAGERFPPALQATVDQ